MAQNSPKVCFHPLVPNQSAIDTRLRYPDWWKTLNAGVHPIGTGVPGTVDMQRMSHMKNKNKNNNNSKNVDVDVDVDMNRQWISSCLIVTVAAEREHGSGISGAGFGSAPIEIWCCELACMTLEQDFLFCESDFCSFSNRFGVGQQT